MTYSIRIRDTRTGKQLGAGDGLTSAHAAGRTAVDAYLVLIGRDGHDPAHLALEGVAVEGGETRRSLRRKRQRWSRRSISSWRHWRGSHDAANASGRRSPGIRYARCDTLAPGIRVDDLTGGTGAPSGGNMPTVVIPPEVPPGLPFGPDAYIADPDGEGVICGDCVKPGEIEQYIPDPRSTAGTVAA